MYAPAYVGSYIRTHARIHACMHTQKCINQLTNWCYNENVHISLTICRCKFTDRSYLMACVFARTLIEWQHSVEFGWTIYIYVHAYMYDGPICHTLCMPVFLPNWHLSFVICMREYKKWLHSKSEMIEILDQTRINIDIFNASIRVDLEKYSSEVERNFCVWLVQNCTMARWFIKNLMKKKSLKMFLIFFTRFTLKHTIYSISCLFFYINELMQEWGCS